MESTAPNSAERWSRTNVLGIAVDAMSMADAVARMERWIAERDRRYVCVCAVNTIMEARRAPEVRRALLEADLVTTDGMPLVWLSRLAGHSAARRVYGPDLLLACLARSAEQGHRHYFHGGRPGVAGRLATALSRRFPGARIAGTSDTLDGTVAELCDDRTAAAINDSNADVVWVGLGAPRQELWMRRMRERLRAPVLVGVGAAFDFHTGDVRQAPPLLRHAGLEWAFRLSQEPRRLWRRYLLGNSRFVFEVLCQTLHLRTYGP
jgi:N-acetylglucosaminyldiphosphoundecaprenol N-acetyl-beta-D-mannosaminyltransferase